MTPSVDSLQERESHLLPSADCSFNRHKDSGASRAKGRDSKSLSHTCWSLRDQGCLPSQQRKEQQQQERVWTVGAAMTQPHLVKPRAWRTRPHCGWVAALPHPGSPAARAEQSLFVALLSSTTTYDRLVQGTLIPLISLVALVFLPPRRTMVHLLFSSRFWPLREPNVRG